MSLPSCPAFKSGGNLFGRLIYFESSNQKMESVKTSHGSNNLERKRCSNMFCIGLCYSFVLFACFHDVYVSYQVPLSYPQC
jgi:hypothetical protein